MFQMKFSSRFVVHQIIKVIIVLHFVHSSLSEWSRWCCFVVQMIRLIGTTHVTRKGLRIACFGHVFRDWNLVQTVHVIVILHGMQGQACQFHQFGFHTAVFFVFLVIIYAVVVITRFWIVQMRMKMGCVNAAKTTFVWRSVIAIVIKTRRQEIVGILSMTGKTKAAHITFKGEGSDIALGVKQGNLGTIVSNDRQASDAFFVIIVNTVVIVVVIVLFSMIVIVCMVMVIMLEISIMSLRLFLLTITTTKLLLGVVIVIV